MLEVFGQFPGYGNRLSRRTWLRIGGPGWIRRKSPSCSTNSCEVRASPADPFCKAADSTHDRLARTGPGENRYLPSRCYQPTIPRPCGAHILAWLFSLARPAAFFAGTEHGSAVLAIAQQCWHLADREEKWRAQGGAQACTSN